MAFSSRNGGGGGRRTRYARVCGILISDIPETSHHRTGEAERSTVSTGQVCIGGQLLA